MKKKFGSMNMDTFAILNDSSVKITFSSDISGKCIGIFNFKKITQVLYQTVLDDNQQCDSIHILEFVIQELQTEEIDDFINNFNFESVPESFIPKFKIGLHGSFVEISFFCRDIIIDNFTDFFNDLNL